MQKNETSNTAEQGSPGSTFIWTETHQLMSERLDFAVRSPAPLVILTGEHGVGKSALVGEIMDTVLWDYSVALATDPDALEKDLKGIVQCMLLGFQQSLDDGAKIERPLLIVDNAEKLREKTLETIIDAADSYNENGPLIKLVLIGNPGFDDIARRLFPMLVGPVVQVPPLSAEESVNLINGLIARMPVCDDFMTAGEIDKLAARSGGNPGRMVNTLEWRGNRKASADQRNSKDAKSTGGTDQPKQTSAMDQRAPEASADSAPPASEVQTEKPQPKAEARETTPPVAKQPEHAASDVTPKKSVPETPGSTVPEAKAKEAKQETKPKEATLEVVPKEALATPKEAEKEGAFQTAAPQAKPAPAAPEVKPKDDALAKAPVVATKIPSAKSAQPQEAKINPTPAAKKPATAEPPMLLEKKARLTLKTPVGPSQPTPQIEEAPTKIHRTEKLPPMRAAPPPVATKRGRSALAVVGMSLATLVVSGALGAAGVIIYENGGLPEMPVEFMAAPTSEDPNDLFKSGIETSGADDVETVVSFALAALDGHTRSAYFLGQIYDAGEGVAASPGVAAAWYAAAATEHEAAAHRLDELKTATTVTTEPVEGPIVLGTTMLRSGQAALIWSDPGATLGTSYEIEFADARGQLLESATSDVSAKKIRPHPWAKQFRVVSVGGETSRAGPWEPIPN